MIKVKEYLDETFGSNPNNTATLKKNGHYEVHGHWGVKLSDRYKDSLLESFDFNNHYSIEFYINNETIIFKVIPGGIKLKNNHYSYLQTYEHLKRGEPDVNGYYARSTDGEVIKYIKNLYEEFIDTYNNILINKFSK